MVFRLGMFGLICGVSVVGILGCFEEYSDLVAKCKTIQLGDTEHHVVKVMGPPTHTSTYKFKGKMIKTLVYPAPSIMPSNPQISVDSESLIVEAIHCEEGYSVVKGRKKGSDSI